MSDNEKTIQSITQIHGFEIIGLISNQGGMADVYEAYQLSVGRRVAAKKLKSSFIHDENIKSRFEKEAKLLGQLNHANIVQVIDFSNEHLTLIMEFIEGKSLEELLAEKESLSLEESLRIISEVLAGLHYAHQHNIIHRDIKPGNIFLTDDGRTKIADFGIAGIVGGNDQASKTEKLNWIGTPAYISPEQVTGAAIGPWSDIYSAGITLYRLVTGKLPFLSDNIVETAVMHIKETPVPPQEIASLISSELSRIILKAISKSPEDRFSTALAFKEAVDRLLYPRKDKAYLQEARAEWEKSRQERTTEKKRRLLNSIKLSQMALAENPDLQGAAQVLNDAHEDLKKIKWKEYSIFGGAALIITGIMFFLIVQLSSGVGKLDLFTSEPADVYLNGVKIGTAPFVFQNIPAGRHRIAVEQPGFYRSDEKDIVVEKGKLLTINEVIPSGGMVMITSSRPGMTVKIDGVESGKTPLTKKLVIGRHSIEAGGVTRMVIIQENDHLRVAF
jgi:serine/threonine-protein kinase